MCHPYSSANKMKIKYIGQTAFILKFGIKEKKIITLQYNKSGKFCRVKMAKKCKSYQLLYQTATPSTSRKHCQKRCQQSPLYQRLRLCSLEAICPVTVLCVSASTKGSEANKERTLKPESMWQFPKTNS
jgi:hypothetical protein